MHRTPEQNRELERDIAATREVAERLGAALDVALRSQLERARNSGAESSLTELEADLADATARLAAVRAKQADLALRIRPAIDRSELDSIDGVKVESEALRGEAGVIAAEIAELTALRAELRRNGGD